MGIQRHVMRCVGINNNNNNNNRKSKVDIWWWNKEMKEAVSIKKNAHKAMSQNNTEENKRYKSMKNKERKKQFQKQ